MDFGLESLIGTPEATPVESATDRLQTDLNRDDFMRLLLTQLQLQDPFEPMENQDMIAQLAQFSSLDQLTGMNDSLEESIDVNVLLGQMQNNNMATNMIGRTVLLDIPVVRAGGGFEPEMGVQLNEPVTDLKIEFFDAAGNVVATLPQGALPAGEHKFVWDGKNHSGEVVQEGTYAYEMRGTDALGNALTLPGFVVGTVDAVRYADGIAWLQVNGEDALMAQVREVRSE